MIIDSIIGQRGQNCQSDNVAMQLEQGATQAKAPAAMAGLAIGPTLAAIHLVGISITGVSVNPARSIGPVLFVGGKALADLWLFILAPLAGGALAGVVFGMGVTRADQGNMRRGPVPGRSTHFLFASCPDPVKTWALPARLSGS